MGIFSRSKSQTTDQIAASTQTPRRAVKLTKGDAPASSRTVIEQAGGVDLAKKFDKAGVSLSKRGLTGIRAQVIMLLDHSGSMDANYRNGTVQTLVERALGFALQVDIDGTVPVVRFDSATHPPVDVTVGNHQTVTGSALYQPNRMGSTNLTAALQAVLNAAKGADEPLFVIIVTDGQPDNPATSTDLARELAGYPVFLKFLSVPDRGRFPGRPFLQGLDDMDGRLIDNADAKFIDDPAGMSDLAFADAMTDEWHSWIAAATRVGLLTE